MRRKRSVPRPAFGVNITSLCDIMLCLLIFFMLVSKRGIDTGADPQIVLPRSLMGMNIEDLGNTLALNVYAGGEQPLVTTLDPRSGQVIEIPLAEAAAEGPRHPLRELLVFLRSGNPEFKVILYADEELDYGFIEPVLIECAAAQVRSVNFATRKPEE